MNLRVMVACKANKAAFASFLGRFESFNGSAGREDLLHFVHRGDLVNLPQVHIISLQSPQGLLEVCLRPLARTLRRLGGGKNVLPQGSQSGPRDWFRFPLPLIRALAQRVEPGYESRKV